MGGMGMIAVGVLGGQVLGTLVDKRVDNHLARQAPALHAQVVDQKPVTNYGLSYRNLDQEKVKALSAGESAELTRIQGETKQGTLKIVAVLPAIMFCCYLGLILYFKARGGYAVQHLEMTGEQASGGIQAPVEA
jgi:hypothetical protein